MSGAGNLAGFREVSKETFWKFIMNTKRNVHPTPTGPWKRPEGYLSVWKDLRTGEIIGYSNEVERSLREDLIVA
jgi:hypothetical protein